MIKRCLIALGCIAALPSVMHAQALPTASRAGVLQAGAGVSMANPDYTQKYIKGITGYATFDFTPHLGVEADVHYTSLITPEDFGENSYEAGIRYVIRKGRYEPYAKGLFGIGSGTFQTGIYMGNQHSTSYPIYSLGAGLDIRFSHHINVRAIDAEFQQWPTFAPHNLTPFMFTVGVAYRLR